MGQGGYVRIHRSLVGHPAFRNDAESMAFAWLIAKAAWKPTRVRYKDRGIHLDRGQLAISIRDFAAALDRDKNWISRVLKRMREEGMIGTEAGTGVLVITICNYDEYQSDCEDRGTAKGTQGGTEAGQRRDTEQGKEEGKKESKSRKRDRSPDFEVPDWVPAEPWAAFAEMRRRKKKPLDDFTAKQLFGRLRSIADAGWNLEDIITKAVIGQHDGFWMPDGRDQNLRRANAPSGQPARQWGADERAAYLAKLERREATGPPGQSLGGAASRVLRSVGGSGG